jgi:type 1 glutamine amidotransferase
MKTLTIICFGLLGCLSAAQADPATALKTFAQYEQGQPPAWVSDARAAVFHQTNDPTTRASREADLLAFLRSDATQQAKAIAIGWLGVIGGPNAIPEIENAGTPPELKEPAREAVLQIRGIAVADESKATRSPKLDRVAALTTSLAKATPADADRALTNALVSGDDRAAMAALRAIQMGCGSTGLAAMVLSNIGKIPESGRGRVFAALAGRPDAAAVLRPYLLRVVREGAESQRADAARNLAQVMTVEDVPALLQIASDANDAAEAAKEALRGTTREGVDEVLTKELAASPPRCVVAMELLTARNATGAVDAIWKLAASPAPETSAAAVKALGGLIPIQQLGRSIDSMLTATTDAQRDIFAKIVWEVARRHPDLLAASNMLYQASEKTASPLKEKLRSQSDRLRPKGSPGVPVTPVPDDRQGLLPNGSEETIRLNCGTATEALRGAVRIRRVAGDSYQFGDVALPQATVDFGAELKYEITGLDASGFYLLGITAWDGDGQGRVQSLAVDGEMVLPEFRPVAWHADQATHMRLQVPVPAKTLADGKITVTVGTLAGPNAVVSEVWLAKCPTDKNRKRVLIVTGDDYPAHHWRETGPEFAAILRTDPQLEVTLCESPYVLAAPGLAEFDTVFLHFKNYQNRLPLGDAQWRGLETYVKNGGGLVIAHFGCGACQEWTGFVNLAGRVWDPQLRGHDPYGEFMVRIANPNHPVTRGMADFKTTDELYTCLAGDTEIEILATATSKVCQTAYPMAFVLTPGKGRVFHCPLGHDVGALKAVGVRDLYLRGTRWTAGLQPTK